MGKDRIEQIGKKKKTRTRGGKEGAKVGFGVGTGGQKDKNYEML